MGGNQLLERVAETILRYSMLPAGCRAGVAVSGGADSICLLHVLRELAPRWNVRLTVLHLNHQLRGAESEEDAEFVSARARDWSLPCIVQRAAIGEGNLEQEAREARLAFFERLLRAGVVDRVATGHTLDDQAETVIYRLLRGSGNAGLAGILPVSGKIVRPLLHLRRFEAAEALRSLGLPWREDGSNSDLRFARNRIRRQLVPAFEEFNPAIAEALAATAELARDEEEYWDQQVGALAGKIARMEGGAAILPIPELLAQPRAVSRRVIRWAFEKVKGDLLGVGFSHVEAVLEIARQPEGHSRVQAPGLDIFRSFELLRVARPRGDAREDRDYDVPAVVPGVTPVPGAAYSIRLELKDNISEIARRGYTKGVVALDADRLTDQMRIRNWRPGDRFSPRGGGEERIKTLFQDARVPIWDRQGWPLMTCGGQIVWARRFGVAAGYAASEASRRLILIEEVRESH